MAKYRDTNSYENSIELVENTCMYNRRRRVEFSAIKVGRELVYQVEDRCTDSRITTMKKLRGSKPGTYIGRCWYISHSHHAKEAKDQRICNVQ